MESGSSGVFGPGSGEVTIDGVVHGFRSASDGRYVLGDERLTVTVRDERGQPARARVRIETPTELTGPVSQIEGVRAIDVRGTFRRLSPGRYRVTAHFDGGAVAEVQVDLPRAHPLILQPRPSGAFDVTITAPDGRPFPGWTVEAMTWLGPAPAFPTGWEGREDADRCWIVCRATADWSGRVRLPAVTAGTVLIRARPRDMYLRDDPAGAERTLVLSAGDTEQLDLRVERPAR